MVSWARLLALLVAVIFTEAIPVGAQTVVDIPTAKRLTGVLLQRNQPAAAREILTALIAREPNDPELLINLSRAERSLGNERASIQAGRSAFRNAATKTQKFHAARTTAQALSSAGRRTEAQLWLRRAGSLAPNEQAEAVIRSEYRHVRARNPLSFSAGLTVTPSDNVNDAPVTNRLVLGPFVGIDPTALPISGIETTFSASATLRFRPTQTAVNSLTLLYLGRRVSLGDEAADINPNLSNEDFRYDRILLGWSGRFRTSEDGGVWDVGVQVFNDENGGAHFQNGQSAQIGYTWSPGDGQSLRIGAGVDLLDRTDRVSRSSETVRLQADWSFPIGGRDRLSLQVVASDTHSESVTVANSATSMRLTYAFGKPVLSTYFAVSGEYRRSVFDDVVFPFSERRQDERITISATATVTGLELYGFAPVLELRSERNRSNISSFDSRSSQFGISIRSTY